MSLKRNGVGYTTAVQEKPGPTWYVLSLSSFLPLSVFSSLPFITVSFLLLSPLSSLSLCVSLSRSRAVPLECCRPFPFPSFFPTPFVALFLDLLFTPRSHPLTTPLHLSSLLSISIYLSFHYPTLSLLFTLPAATLSPFLSFPLRFSLFFSFLPPPTQQPWAVFSPRRSKGSSARRRCVF